MSTHDASPQHQTTATPGGANWHFDTMQTHAGASPAAGHGAHVTPIVASAGFTFDNVDHAASIFSMDTLDSFAYARAGNPTNAVVEQRLAALEGGAGAVLTASGRPQPCSHCCQSCGVATTLLRLRRSMAAPSGS